MESSTFDYGYFSFTGDAARDEGAAQGRFRPNRECEPRWLKGRWARRDGKYTLTLTCPQNEWRLSIVQLTKTKDSQPRFEVTQIDEAGEPVASFKSWDPKGDSAFFGIQRPDEAFKPNFE